MNVSLIKWSKKWLLAIVGLFALAYAGAFAQSKMIRIEDRNQGSNADPVKVGSRYLGVSNEGVLQWLEKPDAYLVNTLWYQITVEAGVTDDDDDYYLQNVATGQFLYRSSSNTDPGGWRHAKALLADVIDEVELEYYIFRTMNTTDGRWDGNVWIANVADADFDDLSDWGAPKKAFCLSGMNKNAGVYDDSAPYPGVAIGSVDDGGNQFTSVKIIEVPALAELVKSKSSIINNDVANNYLVEKAGNLEWGAIDKSDIGLSTWYIIPVDLEDMDGDFYIKNASSGKYIKREGTKTPPEGGDWERDNALLEEELDTEDDAFVFRFVGNWDDGTRGWIVSMLDVVDDSNPPREKSAFSLSGGPDANPGPGDWRPSAKFAYIGDGGNVWTSTKIIPAVEVMYYTVTFKRKNSESDIVQSVKEDDNATEPADPIRTNYVFKGWFESNDDDAWETEDPFDFDTPITANLTLYAGWEFQEEELVERYERTIRIRGFRGGISEIQEPYREDAPQKYYVRYNADIEVEEGKEETTSVLEWSGIEDDYSAWVEIPVPGSNYDSYYKNVGSGKFLYRGSERGITLPAPSWRWEYALMSDENEETDFFKFRLERQSSGSDQWWLYSVAEAVGENPINANGSAFVLGPMNINHNGDQFDKYPAVIMITQDARSGNAWSRVHIDPIRKPVRITGYNGDPPSAGPEQYLSVKETKETVENEDGEEEEINVFLAEWSESMNDSSAWYEIQVDGSSNEFYYQNVATGRYIYRETKELEGDWGQAKALISSNYEPTDYYHFRKEQTDWWGNRRVWLVNIADAEFDADGKFVDKKAYILSGINKNLDWMNPEYPAALMHIMPDRGNVWSSVLFEDAVLTQFFVLTINMGGLAPNVYRQIAEGEPVECHDEPASDGYDFEGWFLDAEFKVAYNCEEPVEASENITLYAKWEEKKVSEECTPDIKIVRIATNQNDGKCREFLRATQGGNLTWSRYFDTVDGACGNYGTDFDPEDMNSAWYQIPVPGSNFDFYFKNVQTGLYLYLEPESGLKYGEDHERAGEWRENGEAWVWKSIGLSNFNFKGENYKWRVLRGSWQDQNWGACYIGSAYGVTDWNAKSGFFTISGHRRLHTGFDNFPPHETPHAHTLGESYLDNGNVWCAASIWISEETRDNPDCCADGVECCDKKECEEPCIPNPLNPCECSPNSDDCLFPDCDIHTEHPDCSAAQSSGGDIYLQYLKLFPNPTNDHIFISGLAGGELITIYSINGQRLMDTIATGEQTGVAVSQLPKGTYIVKVSTGKGEWSTKFVVN